MFEISYFKLVTDIFVLQLILRWHPHRRPLNLLCLSPTAAALACLAHVLPAIHTMVRIQ